MGRWCGWVAHGGRQVIGGAKIVGREMNGMSPWKSVQRFHQANPPLRPCKSFIGFIASWVADRGLLKERTTKKIADCQLPIADWLVAHVVSYQ
jgi:hypothetical protein